MPKSLHLRFVPYTAYFSIIVHRFLTCDTILHSVQTKAKNTKFAFKTLEKVCGIKY